MRSQNHNEVALTKKYRYLGQTKTDAGICLGRRTKNACLKDPTGRRMAAGRSTGAGEPSKGLEATDGHQFKLGSSIEREALFGKEARRQVPASWLKRSDRKAWRGCEADEGLRKGLPHYVGM